MKKKKGIYLFIGIPNDLVVSKMKFGSGTGSCWKVIYERNEK